MLGDGRARDGEGDTQVGSGCPRAVVGSVHEVPYFFTGIRLSRPLRISVPVGFRGVAVVLERIRPADAGHGPVDIDAGARLIIRQCEGGIHSRHDRLADVDIGNFARVDADVAVAELPSTHTPEPVPFHRREAV